MASPYRFFALNIKSLYSRLNIESTKKPPRTSRGGVCDCQTVTKSF